MNNQAGKGSKPRPVNKEAYDSNYEQIVWSSKKNSSTEERKNKNKITYKY